MPERISQKPTGEINISSYVEESANGENKAEVTVGMKTDTEDINEMDTELSKLDRSSQYLTAEEKDLLGEMGNICMGASATTMYTLLGRRVNITTPNVHVLTFKEVVQAFHSPFVIVTVEYNKGLDGENLLIIKESDSKLITDLLMGGDGNIDA